MHNTFSSDLEKQRAKEKRDSKELQTKYDLLEEDFVVQKAQVCCIFMDSSIIYIYFKLFQANYLSKKACKLPIYHDDVLQYTTKNEGVQEEYEKLVKEHNTIEKELKTLRETYNSRQDTWIKEKLNMQVTHR